MTIWIAKNLASIILLLILAAIIFVIVRKKIRDRKLGKCRCGCDHCSGCTTHQKGEKT